MQHRVAVGQQQWHFRFATTGGRLGQVRGEAAAPRHRNLHLIEVYRMALGIHPIEAIADLEAYQEDWDRLAGEIPFRRWTWNRTWWRHYGECQPAAHLLTLAVTAADGHVVALAPWYLRSSWIEGRTLQFLGDGEVASDYLGVLAEPGAAEAVGACLAEWLWQRNQTGGPDRRWDLLRLKGLEGGDAVFQTLLADARVQKQVYLRGAASCWRLPLPATWDAYVSCLSKSHRKQVRRVERKYLDSGRAVLHFARDREGFERGWKILVDLHQRRRACLGGRGCFASARFATFHREVALAFLAEGRLRLGWLELDGRPVAAEYHFSGGGTIYAYQSGIDPASAAHEPGNLITVALLRQAIGEGFGAFDFLRGDEPYKAHWRAQPRPSLELRIASDSAWAQLRHLVWRAAVRLRHWSRPRGLWNWAGELPPSDSKASIAAC